MSKMSNVRALQGLISPIQFVEIVDWNKLRNGLVCNEELEDAMLREELQEYFDATELVDKLDAVADYLFVAGGTVTKYAYDFDEAPSIVDELDVILSDFAGRCEVAGIDAQIVGKLINDALGVVIEANKQINWMQLQIICLLPEVPLPNTPMISMKPLPLSMNWTLF